MPNLILIGAPGSGKTTLGQALATKLNLPFVDTDAVVEKTYCSRISDIFVDKGEEYFRDLEYEAFVSALEIDDCILSLGGGAPISQRAQTLLRSKVVPIIFLDVSLAVAAPRVGFNRDRPLLLTNPRAQWQNLAEARRPIYESLATHIVKVDGMSVDELVTAVTGKM